MKLCYAVASILGSIAEREARRVGVPMAIAIVDGEGGLLLFGRMDGTLPASTEIAVCKAYTAAVLRMATEEVGQLAQPGGMLYGIQQTHGGRIVLFGGGVPLRLEGQVAGAVGISGGSVPQDVEVAQPVVAALEQMERCCERIKKVLPGGVIKTNQPKELEVMVREALLQVMGDHPPGEVSILAGALHLLFSEGQ